MVARVGEDDDRDVRLVLPEVDRLLGLDAEDDDRLEVLARSDEHVVVLVPPRRERRVIEDREAVVERLAREDSVRVGVREDVALGQADLVEESLDALPGVADERAADDRLVGARVGRDHEDARLARAGPAAEPDGVEIDPGVVVRVEPELVAGKGRDVVRELGRRTRVEVRGGLEVAHGRLVGLGKRHLPACGDRARLGLASTLDRVGARHLPRVLEAEGHRRLDRLGGIDVEHARRGARRHEGARLDLRRRILGVGALVLEDLASERDLAVHAVERELHVAASVGALGDGFPVTGESTGADLGRIRGRLEAGLLGRVGLADLRLGGLLGRLTGHVAVVLHDAGPLFVAVLPVLRPLGDVLRKVRPTLGVGDVRAAREDRGGDEYR